MAKNFSTKDAQAIARWHLDLMSRLSSVATDEHAAELNAIRRAYADMVSGGYFEQSFTEEVVKGNATNFRSTALEKLLTALLSHSEALSRSSQCASILATNKPEIERLLDDLNPALRGIGWFITSGRKKVNAEAAYDRLTAMKDGAYGDATCALLNQNSTPSLSADSVWNRFTEDPEGFRANLVECCNIPSSPNHAREVDAILSRFQEISEEEDEIEEAPRRAEAQTKDAIQSMLESRTSELLKSVPLEELRRYKKGIRLSALLKAGCTSVADLEGKDFAQLVGKYGVSWDAARDLIQAVKKVRASAADSSKIKISVDKKTPESTALVTSLYMLLRITKIASDFSQLSEEKKLLTNNAVSVLRKYGHPTIWPFRPAHERAEVAVSYRSLQATLDGDFGTDVERRYGELCKFTGRDSSAMAWASFAEDPTRFFNLIESLAPGVLGSDEDFLQGLPQKLVEEIKDEALPSAGLKCQLRRYQEWGVKYILHQGKVLLGDEMGLGKTIEAIAAMVALQNTGMKRFLVVCPASVLPNWCREITKHSDLNAIKVHGADRQWKLASWLEGGGVAVTTYETVGVVKLSKGDTIDMLVVDEAHYVKNPETKRSKNVIGLIKSSKRVLFMTGTALENNVDEMITLISYLRPDIAKKAQKYSSFATATAFREAIAPVYYRRKRSDVLTELPELIEYDSWCDMTDAEISAYEAAALAGGKHAMRRVSWNVGDPTQSTKLKRLREIVEEAKDDGRRVIVFSFYLDTVAMIHEALGDSSLLPITGGVSPRLRQNVIDQFNSSPAGSVLISQITAGGTGLNIQAASVVVICEPQYKPSTESQAISRAYRMGQVHNVIVHRLLASGTIDEKIVEILDAKQTAFDVFADKSVAAEDNLCIDDKEARRLIAEEIERIKIKHKIINEDISNGLHTPRQSPETAGEMSEEPELEADGRAAADIGVSSNPLIADAEIQTAAAEVKKSVTGRVRSTRRKRTFTFSVAGLNMMHTGRRWMSASAHSVTAVREKDNEYDENAVALHINGRKAGYIPREIVPPIAALIDEGYEANVISVDANKVPKKRRRKDEWGDYYYEEDWNRAFYVAKVKVTLQRPEEKTKTKKPTRSAKSAAPAALSKAEANRLRGHLPEALSAHHAEAYLLLAQGMSRGDAGFAMGVRESTMQDYTRVIYKVLNIHNKQELIQHARRLLERADEKGD